MDRRHRAFRPSRTRRSTVTDIRQRLMAEPAPDTFRRLKKTRSQMCILDDVGNRKKIENVFL